MKLNRLLEITTILLNRKSVTAGELAERFGVSTRTIYRDIDVLSTSGVPVYASQGANGGISILEEYTVNRTALLNSEKESILFALQTLQSTKYPAIDTVLEKLGGLFKNTETDWISIDFSPWGSDPNAYDKFSHIRGAILQRKVLEIVYINSFNEKTKRRIEPHRLIFKSQTWYLWGYCLQKKSYRIFRISRIKQLEVTNVTFARGVEHETDDPSHDACALTDSSATNSSSTASSRKDSSTKVVPYTHLVLEFTVEALYRLYDDYDDRFIRDNGNGTYTLEVDFPVDEWVYGYILSFGPFVKVIEPSEIRACIIEKSKKVLEQYQ